MDGMLITVITEVLNFVTAAIALGISVHKLVSERKYHVDKNRSNTGRVRNHRNSTSGDLSDGSARKG